MALIETRLNGRTFLELARRPNIGEMPDMVLEICRALIPLGRLGIVHADLKPANLLLCDDVSGGVRLLDFGSARSRARPTLPGEDEGTDAATPPYAAPELMRGWNIDPRADQYSLGITLRHVCPSLGISGGVKRIIP